MISFQGVETVSGHPRDAVFAAGMVKANWPSAAGVHIGPEAEHLVDGGLVRATLELPGVVLTVGGRVTHLEAGRRIEASGRQAGIWAATTVEMTDNAESTTITDLGSTDGTASVETTVTWLFEARLPFYLSVLEFPATVAIKVAIPVLRERFIANILRYLGESGASPAASTTGSSAPK